MNELRIVSSTLNVLLKSVVLFSVSLNGLFTSGEPKADFNVSGALNVLFVDVLGKLLPKATFLNGLLLVSLLLVLVFGFVKSEDGLGPVPLTLGSSFLSLEVRLFKN